MPDIELEKRIRSLEKIVLWLSEDIPGPYPRQVGSALQEIWHREKAFSSPQAEEDD